MTASSGSCPITESLADPRIQECPHALHKRLRDEAPVHFDQTLGMYVLTRFDDLREVLRNWEVFSSVDCQKTENMRPLPPEVKEIQARGWPLVEVLATTDPPAHTRYRKILEYAFSPKRVRAMRPYMDEIVYGLIDGFIDRGETDFVTSFATPLPMLVIADQLGVPRSDAYKFKEWSDNIIASFGMMISDEDFIRCAESYLEFQRYFHAVIEDHRANPRDDILSAMVTAEVDGEPQLDIPELLALTQQLLVAGNETTTNSIAAGMQMLIENPDVAARLRADPSLIPAFAEEVVRLESPVQGLFRVVHKDITLHGVTIPAGSYVHLRFAAANRDERRIDNPDALDIGRRNIGGHLGFGSGIHHCLGAQLARMEMLAAFEALLARLDNLRFLPNTRLEHHPNLVVRGLKSLYIGFDKRSG